MRKGGKCRIVRNTFSKHWFYPGCSITNDESGVDGAWAKRTFDESASGERVREFRRQQIQTRRRRRRGYRRDGILDEAFDGDGSEVRRTESIDAEIGAGGSGERERDRLQASVAGERAERMTERRRRH